MARLLQDGAETGDLSLLVSSSTSGGGTLAVTASPVRSGNWAYNAHCPTSGTAFLECATSVSTAQGQFHGSLWFYIPTGGTPSTNTRIAYLSGASSARLSVWLDASRDLSLVVGAATQVGSTLAGAVNEGQWYHLELKVNNTASTAAADAEAWLNGTSFASGTGLSIAAIDTIVAGLANTCTGRIIVDDLAMNSAAGSANTGRIGDDKIVHMRVAGNGNTHGTQGTDWDTGPSTGGTMWQQIDEAAPANDATDYIELIVNSTGPTDRFHDFTLESIASAGVGASDTITAVGVGARVISETVASCTYVRRIKSQSGGTVIESTATTLNISTWQTNDDVATTDDKTIQPISQSDPQAGGPWTPALLGTAQIGVRAPDAAPDVWISSLWLSVAHVPGVGGGGVNVNVLRQSMRGGFSRQRGAFVN